jgi:hypothetical protein
MRHLPSLITHRKPSARPSTDSGRRAPAKGSPEPKPVRKRCLNEAAHKLDR